MTNEELYDNEMMEINRRAHDDATILDRMIFVLSSGAIVLSVTMVIGNLKDISSQYLPLLYFSWTFFFLSIVMTLISYMKAIKGQDRLMDILEDWHDRNFTSPAPDTRNDPELKKLGKWVSTLTTSSVITLIIGISLLIVFAALTINDSLLS